MATKKGPSTFEIEVALVELLSGKTPHEFRKAPPFPHKFLVARTSADAGAVALRVLDEEVVEPTLEGYIAGDLSNYLEHVSGAAAKYAVPCSVCESIVASWMNKRADLHALPKAVSFKSDKGYCLDRHKFDPAECGIDELVEKAPTFSEMLTRCTNSDAFCMRIGSIFDPDADRKQAVWLSGPPDCGKSQFIWLIKRLSGKSFFPITSKVLKNSFWGEPLIGKRVGLVIEAGVDFIKSEDFKALTGDGTHPINRKNRAIVSAEMIIMLFFSSNDEPAIPPDDSLMLRIIDCRLASMKRDQMVGETTLRARLESELPYIAGYCMARYASLPKGARIPCDGDALRETAGGTVADIEDFLEHVFQVGSKNDFVTRRQFRELMVDARILSPRDQSTCKQLLLRQFGAVETRRWFDTEAVDTRKQVWIYQGIRLREDRERRFVSEDASRSKQGNVLSFKTGKNGSD